MGGRVGSHALPGRWHTLPGDAHTRFYTVCNCRIAYVAASLLFHLFITSFRHQVLWFVRTITFIHKNAIAGILSHVAIYFPGCEHVDIHSD